MMNRLRHALTALFAPLVAALCAALCIAMAASADPTPMERRLTAAHAAGDMSGLHAVIAVYRGETLAEMYFEGVDQNWGQPLGVRSHGPDSLHDLRSVSKSVTGLLYGIALAQGLVPDPEASLFEQFPQYADLTADPARRLITVEDALTMRMGIEWNENLPYTNPQNSEIAMERADDRYRFILSRPLTGPPGEVWVYNGGATALIGHLIEQGTGMSLPEFAAEVLFRPLGIKRFEWARGRDGTASAASGLRLSARSLLKLGQMIKAGGRYEGTQVVPESWLAQSRTAHTRTSIGLRYGYFWWLPPGDNAPRWMAGLGNGGQRLTVNPVDDLILIVLGGRYNDPNDWRLPVKVIEDFLVPEIRRVNAGD